MSCLDVPRQMLESSAISFAGRLASAESGMLAVQRDRGGKACGHEGRKGNVLDEDDEGLFGKSG